MTDVYNNFKELLFNGGVDLDGDTIRAALVSDTPAYTPDIDGEAFVNDVLDGGTTANELNATNYARKDLSITVTQDDADDEGVADATDLTWSSLGGATNDTIAGVLIYKEVGADDSTPGDDPVIAYITSSDFPLTTNGGDVTVSWAAEGVLNVG